MKKLLILLFVICISLISGLCNENQIDINSASSIEIEKKINGIGPVYAQRIIDSRPFESVDELIKVSGIGEITLEKIKSEGLACVSEETSNKESEENLKNETSEESQENDEIKETGKDSEPIILNQKDPVEREKIQLDPKVIKTNENSQKDKDRRIYIYGLVGFFILISALTYFKTRKQKNEFR